MDSPAFIRYLYTICFFSVFHDILFQPTAGNITKSPPVGPLGRNSGRNQNQNRQEKYLFFLFSTGISAYFPLSAKDIQITDKTPLSRPPAL